MRTLRGVFPFLALTILILTVTAAVAQSDRGTLAGTILDSSGAVVSGAAITVSGTDTGTVYNAVSSSSGGYRIPDIRLGAYTVKVAATGFKTAERTGVVIQVNSVSALDITLETGDVKETMTVVADAPTLQTESSEIGTVVTSKQIQDLPLALNSTGQSHLRSTESFVFLTPGTAGPGTNSDSPSSGVFESKLSGGQNFSTEVLLDGASIVHAELGSTFDENAPSVEALNEFKVTTSTISAEFGRTTGGIESFTTKSGSNAFHGTAFDILRNDKLDANSWFNNHQLPNPAPKPRDHQNDFGGSLGGPIWIPKLYNGRNKSFFFFSWEQYRNNEGTTNLTTLPTDDERSGNFSALLGAPTGATNPCDGTPVLKGQIFDPQTGPGLGGVQPCRIAFPGNIIPTDRLSTVSKNVLGFLQVHPNVAPSEGNLNGLINNFLFLSNKPVRDTTMTFRLDHNLGNADKFFFSYSSRDQEQLNGTPALPPPLDQNFFKSRFSHYIRFGWDRTISPTLLNHFNVGYNRLNDPSKGVAVTGQDWEQTLGITGASGPAFPQLSYSGSPLNVGYQGIGGGSFDNAIPNGLLVADSVSWVRGRHSLRMGFEWRHSQFSRIPNANTSPTFNFKNLQTAVVPNDAQTGDPFASFLLGLPNDENLVISSHNPRWVSNYYAAYAQDDFKFRKDLTFNIGIRYDVDTPRHEAEGVESVLDLTAPNNGSELVPISPSVPGALIYGKNATGAKTYYKDFAPRLGFAYAPERLFGRIPNIVVRGGYGIYYSAISYSDFGDGFTSGTTANPTFASQDNFSPVTPLDSGFPQFPPPTNTTDPARKNGGFAGDPDYAAAGYGRPGMVQNWSFEIQHQLAQDLILSVGYVGTRATRLRSNLVQVNSIFPKYYSLGTKLDHESIGSPEGQATLASLGITVPGWFQQLYGDGEPIGQLLRPFPQYQNINSSASENVGQSTFHALEVKLERRFRNGLNLLAAYTFSKTLTDADSTFPTFSAFASNNFGAQNPFNLKTEKTLSYQDTPHALVISYLYEIPVGPGKKYLNHGVASKVLGGWQISGVHRYQSGSPVIMNSFAPTPPFSGGNFKYSRVPGVPIYSADKGSFNPELPTGCSENSVDGTFSSNTNNNYFNCAAFFDQNAQGLVAQRGYKFGDLPLTLGNVRSNSYFSEDFAIIKRVPLSETHVLSLKVDIPNAFNRHIFGTLDGNITSSTFGIPKGPQGVINARRQIQLTMRYQF